MDLLAVLRMLGFDAKAAFVRSLQANECLKSVRLASRELRNTIDSGVCHLTLTIEARDKERWTHGLRLPLRRWTSLESISIHKGVVIPMHSDSEGDVEDDEEVQRHFAELLPLPFLGQPQECLARIRRVRLDDVYTMAPALQVSWLLYNLRSLTSFGLTMIVSDDPQEQQLVASALDSLPCLNSLTLLTVSMVSKLGPSAANLTELVLGDISYRHPDQRIALGHTEFLQHLAVLPKLQKLNIGIPYLASDHPEMICGILDQLPPNLEQLDLLGDRGMDAFEFHFGATGSISSLSIGTVDTCCLASFTSSALLPCKLLAKGPIGKLRVSEIWFDEEDVTCPNLLDIPQLLQRCNEVDIGTISFVGKLDTHVGLEMWQLLGGKVQQLCLDRYHHIRYIHIHTRRTGADACGPPVGLQTVNAGPAVRVQPHTPALAPIGVPQPPPEMAIYLAVSNMLVAPGERAGGGGEEWRDRLNSSPLVLLDGTFVDMLGLNEESLRTWLRSLSSCVTMTAAASPKQPLGQQAEACVSYTYLPCISSVLAHCYPEVAAGVLVGPDCLQASKAHAPAALAELELRARRLALPKETFTLLQRTGDVFRLEPIALIDSMQTVLQSAWDGSLEGVVGREEDRLRWVLDVWGLVTDLVT